MVVVAQKYQDRWPRIKDNIQEAFVYFKKNRDYYNETRKFVLKSNITPEQESALDELQRPCLQFNVLEAYVSRLLGEFSKQSPGIEATSEPSEKAPAPEEIEFVENHMRSIIDNLNSYEIYRDQLTGGFSCIKVWTEYENPKSFNQKICCDRVFDPLLVGFDPAAQKSHKGDGSYCFELIPLTEDQAHELYPDIDFTHCYKKDIQGFQWGYKTGKKRIILFCNYYEKKNKKVMIYRLSDNRVRTKQEYEEIIIKCNESGDVVPAIVDKRLAEIPHICRYQLTKDMILEYKETEFCALPLIFVDGNSAMIKIESSNSDTEQVTKAYVHNAIDTQKLKNVSGQTIANKIETMVQSQWKVAIESIPNGYEEAYKNPQQATALVYKAYGNDSTPLPPPQEVMQMPLPQEVIATFMGADETIQGILGSYNAAAGITDNDLSGKAMMIGTTNSSFAAMPFMVNFLSALQQMCKIVLDLIPKYYITPRSVPVITSEGKREHVSINNPEDPRSLKIQYSPSDLNIVLTPGVNFDAQKNQALQTIEALAQSLPSFAQMINEKGLPIICDNLSIKGADQLKKMAEEWMQAQKEKAALMLKMQQGQQQQNPEMMKIQQSGQKMQMENQNKQYELQQKDREIDIKQQEVGIKQQAQNLDDAMSQIKAINDRIDSIVQMKKNQTERQVHGLNLAMQKEENDRAHVMKAAEHAHKVGEHHHQVAMDLINADQANHSANTSQTENDEENQ
jgi:hypothetical protein